MQLIYWKAFLAVLLAFCPVVCVAYVGPGLGVGVIGVILGVIGSILIALFAVFWYPLKRMLKQRKQKRANEDANTTLPKKMDEDSNKSDSENQN